VPERSSATRETEKSLCTVATVAYATQTPSLQATIRTLREIGADMGVLLTDEVAAALAKFYHGGQGPLHSALTASFIHAGYSDADPYDPVAGTRNNEQRVLAVTRADATAGERAEAGRAFARLDQDRLPSATAGRRNCA
jgi:citrate lyase beta subunit